MKIRSYHLAPSLVLLFLFVLLCLPATGQTDLEAKVDEYIKDHMAAEKIPGISVAVMREGKIILAKGYGLANVEHNVPVKPETVFQSGSVGKAFTVFAIMMLVDEGKLKLEDKINRYLTDAPPEWDGITVSDLLEHTSGMGGYPDDFDYREDLSEDEMYKFVRATPLAFRLGEKRGYSNLGFVTLGLLIHKVTGKFYGDFLKERVFTPLGMTTARIISEADIIPNRAAGYRIVDGELKNQEWVAPTLNTTADGALYLSVLDMANFEAALHQRKLLSPSSYDAMWKKVVTNDGVAQPWGFSWHIKDVNGKKIIGHSGGWQGFTANFDRYPEKDLAVIAFTNRRGANPEVITRELMAIFAPELSIDAIPAIEDKEPQVTAIARDFLVRLGPNKLEATMFAPPASEDIFPNRSQIAGRWLSFGELQSIELLAHTDKEDGVRDFRYRVRFAKRKLLITIRFNKENKISDAFPEWD
ncbi:MAG TPA: serine hydrolase domain-containing protein [Pyrinomonadaceae bacterium]|nr:serine hydrolase domain-containing protein [Pyrinomonadaceae bacterium]